MSEQVDEFSDELESDEKAVMARMEFPAPDKAKNEKEKSQENKIIRLLEKNPLGMTLPEMAGG
ncbi:MAG: hypothetical protein K2X81_01315, partial [Candidatus Obscuribacterales bacterium]|nr:hypothetical protein [Candidatus Obscuribacterales bacterium]